MLRIFTFKNNQTENILKNTKNVNFVNFSKKNENRLFGTFLRFSLKINKNEFFNVIIEKT